MSPTDSDCLRRLTAVEAGPVALRHLRGRARRGEVLASFRHSAYVRLGPDEIVCVCTAGLRPGPLNLVVQAPETLFAGLLAGAPVAMHREGLCLDDRHLIDLTSVVEWHPPQLTGRNGRRAIGPGLAMLARHLEDRQPSDGFGPLVRQLCTDWTKLDPRGGEIDLIEAAVPALRDLLAWLAGSHPAPAPVAGLIGLGPGLTPSGDDLLCGVLVTLHSTGRRAIAVRLAEAVMGAAARGTSLIARAHLSCACEGLGSEALHEALRAVLECDGAALERALDGLSGTGHSSGWDGLAGVVACLAVLEASQRS